MRDRDDELREALEAGRAMALTIDKLGKENDLLRQGPTAAAVLQFESMKRLVFQWQETAADRSRNYLDLFARYKRKLRKLRKARRVILQLRNEALQTEKR